MLTKLTLRNFKRFGEVEIELGNPVVLVGPNNSGKTSALQALTLWDLGLKRWGEKNRDRKTGGRRAPGQRIGAVINRKDVLCIPIPKTNLLWRDLHLREAQTSEGGKPATKNIRIEIILEGTTKDKEWTCGLEFDYANEESFYCRPVRLGGGTGDERMSVPEEAFAVSFAFLPPMSGLAASETILPPGAINVRIGEGRTAEVLRNLCSMVREKDMRRWNALKNKIHGLFGITLEEPVKNAERGEVEMSYSQSGISLDLSCSGRGAQQTLLLLAYMHANPGSVILLDEPDAHLEFLRQRQTYEILSEVARDNGNQLIIATHSEVLLNEAAGRDMVVAFVGKPHRIDDRGSQAAKALKEIGYEHYVEAEQRGWVLYLEGPTDLKVLRAFAAKLNHREAASALESPFVHYVADKPGEVSRHFYGVREAVPHLKAVAIFDRLDKGLPENLGALGLTWRRREIENYFCYPETLEAYAEATAKKETAGPLFEPAEIAKRKEAMAASIKEIEGYLRGLDKGSPWDDDFKVSDEFLIPLFKAYFKRLGIYNLMDKKGFYELAEYVPVERIDGEVAEKLDALAAIAREARPISSDI